MRRSVTAVMSGVSLVVVGVSLRSSWEPVGLRHATGVAKAGVLAASSGPTASAAPRAAVRAKASTHASPAATHHARKTVVTVPATHRPSPTPAPAPKSVTVNGDAVDTNYGPVQVQIVVRAGKIVKADAIEYPQGSQTDQSINSQAIPQLDDETLQAQSANIDSVSGATYTSEGYIGSLQSAIDAAHNAGLM